MGRTAHLPSCSLRSQRWRQRDAAKSRWSCAAAALRTWRPACRSSTGCSNGSCEYAGFDLALEVEPGAAEVEVAEAGSALGRALAEPLRTDGARGYGFASMTSAEALASVVLEVSDEPLARLERRSHARRASAGSAPTSRAASSSASPRAPASRCTCAS